jgi:hypothetical protein
MSLHSQTHALAVRFAEHLSKGDFGGAFEQFYADDAVQIEAYSMAPGQPTETKGKDLLRQKAKEWEADTTIHGYEQAGPYTHGNRFAIVMKIDVTHKSMNNMRMKMEEVCLYTVEAGKIIKAEFFYEPMPG